MMRIIKMTIYKNKENFSDYIDSINRIRAKYLWSIKTYNETNIENVYLIGARNTTVGFIECSYQNLEFSFSSPVCIFLHEIHIAPEEQNKGLGKEVLQHLLKKGIPIEMVVAKENTKMLSLLSKFNVEDKYTNTNTKTVVIKP